MRILVVTWIVDAGILSIENIIREMLRRGHYVEIYACALRRKHTWMFDELGIPIQSVDRLTDEIVKGFDIILDFKSSCDFSFDLGLFQLGGVPPYPI